MTGENRKNVKLFSFNFKEDIDKVYQLFLSHKLIERVGFSNSSFSIEESPNSYIIRWIKPIKFEYEISLNYIKEEKNDYKELKKKVIKINEKKLATEFNLHYSFYRNTSDNSTVILFELIYELFTPNIYKEITKFFEENIKTIFIDQFQNYLETSINVSFHNESILIFRPISQIFNFISDFKQLFLCINKNDEVIIKGKDKFLLKNNKTVFEVKQMINNKNSFFVVLERNSKSNVLFLYFTVYKLSPISCYFNLETKIPFHVEGKVIGYLSEYQQSILKIIKKHLESNSCTDDN